MWIQWQGIFEKENTQLYAKIYYHKVAMTYFQKPVEKEATCTMFYLG